MKSHVSGFLSLFAILVLGVLPAVSATTQAMGANSPFAGGTVGGVQTVTSGASPTGQVPVSSSEQKVETKLAKIGFVNVNTRLNVRQSPWGTIIGKLYDGDKLKILGKEGDWLIIEWNGGTAYVHSAYVEIGESREPITVGNNSGQPGTNIPAGNLDPAKYGYSQRFKAVFDIVERFSKANSAYVFGAGHTKNAGYAAKTDCSGFVGQFIQKLSAASGIPPVFPYSSWYPSSQVYKTKHTNKVTGAFPPPNPRDLIKPGDVFVLNPGSNGIGHTGLFMGYTPDGQPIIAHSTPSRVKRNTLVSGKVGYSGVRIEVLPRRYASRWAGVYRVKNMEKMLDKVSSRT